MQNHRAIQPTDAFFLHLPQEISKFIIKLCEDKDIQQLAKTSKAFNRMIDEMFIGKAIRFKNWQLKEADRLSTAVSHFIDDRRETSTQRFIASLRPSSSSHSTVKISGVVVKLLALYLLYDGLLNIYQYFTDGNNKNLYTFGFDACMMAMLAITHYFITNEQHQNDQTRRRLIEGHNTLTHLTDNISEGDTARILGDIQSDNTILLNSIRSMPLNFDQQTLLLNADEALSANSIEATYLSSIIAEFIDSQRFQLQEDKLLCDDEIAQLVDNDLNEFGHNNSTMAIEKSHSGRSHTKSVSFGAKEKILDARATRLVILKSMNDLENVNDAIVLTHENSEFYVIKMGESERCLQLNLLAIDKKRLLHSALKQLHSPITEVNDPALLYKIKQQIILSAVKYFNHTAAFWQSKQERRFSQVSEEENMCIEIKRSLS